MGPARIVAAPVEAADDIRATLAQVWEESATLLDERVRMVEAAATALASGRLGEDERIGAQHAAHKLAGSLGMLGAPRGSEIALEAEALLARQPRRPARLAELARTLRIEFDQARP